MVEKIIDSQEIFPNMIGHVVIDNSSIFLNLAKKDSPEKSYLKLGCLEDVVDLRNYFNRAILFMRDYKKKELENKNGN